MPRRSTRSGQERDPYAEVTVEELSIAATPSGGLHPGAARVARLGAGPVVAAAIVAATLAVLLPGARSAAPAQAQGLSGIGAAFHYPSACLSAEPSRAAPQWVRVRLDRASPCWRYGVWVTVVVHRSGGAWHVVFERSSYGCPVRAIPVPVQRQLGVCPHEGP